MPVIAEKRQLSTFSTLCLSVSLLVPYAACSDISTGADPDTGLRFWLFEDRGVLLELKQRLPDQTRGFFEARGFDQDSANRAATACIFQTMFRNTGNAGSGRVEIDQTSWRVVIKGNKQPMLLRDDWKNIWQESGLPMASQIAFEWSLLPTHQSYDPLDYNWGMTSYGLPPGSVFDLEFSWTRDGSAESALIKDIQCPDDIHPDPPSNS